MSVRPGVKSWTAEQLQALFVQKIGDTMTGKLTITPTSGDDALIANKDVTVKAGQKIYVDGA